MKRIFIGILFMTLSSCATGYKKAGAGGTVEGYDEAKIQANVYRVNYQGLQGASPLQIYANFLRRSAELAKQDGAKYFKVSEGNQGVSQVPTLGGLALIPSYTGTVTFIEKMEQGAFVTDDVLKQSLTKPVEASKPTPAPTNPLKPTSGA